MIPGNGLIQLNFINTFPCEVNVDYSVANENNTIPINALSYEFVQDLKANQTIYARAVFKDSSCADLLEHDTGTIELGKGSETLGYFIIITERDSKLVIARLNNEEQLEKSEMGQPYVAWVNIIFY